MSNNMNFLYNGLQGKVALVTGASRGIGRAIALELSKNGVSIVINYRKDKEGAEETLRIINENGGYAKLFRADVSSYDEAENMLKEINANFGRIDILVNNAGISKVGLFMDMNEADFKNIIDTNLIGTINCSHAAIKYMLNKKSGAIINISSMWGNVGASCEVVYSASKGAINAFTKALARELGPSNIRVNAIAPGVINTEMNNWLSDEEKDELKEEISLMKFGEGYDVGKLVAFLASEDSRFMTAQIITLDGGMI